MYLLLSMHLQIMQTEAFKQQKRHKTSLKYYKSDPYDKAIL